MSDVFVGLLLIIRKCMFQTAKNTYLPSLLDVAKDYICYRFTSLALGQSLKCSLVENASKRSKIYSSYIFFKA
jgi:hypothetical protein